MKKIIFISIFLISIISHSQTKEELLDLVANETCECINMDELDNLSNAELEMKLGLCMMESYSKRSEKFKDFGIGNGSVESAEELGELVGMKMAFICPKVFSSFIENEDLEELEKSHTGIIKSISGNDFNYVYLEDENNKTHKFLWLRNFEGSSGLMINSKIKSKVVVYYINIECFIPKMNDYYSLKEITKIEFL